jgi:diacylglycerol kinase (ATP)
MGRMKRDWFASFNDAASGLVHTTKTQRNLRYHLLFAFLAVILSLFLNISRLEFVVLTLVIGVVISAELVNSAIEGVVDLAAENFHPLAKAAKDTAAAAVLVAAGAAFTCGYLILAPKMEQPVLSAVDYVEKGPWYVAGLAVIGVVLLVVAGKASFGKGQVLRGGMPSGHAAVAFSLATAIGFITHSFIVIFLAFALALMVAQSRLLFRIHSFREVLFGSLLGLLFTILIFQLIR